MAILWIDDANILSHEKIFQNHLNTQNQTEKSINERVMDTYLHSSPRTSVPNRKARLLVELTI